MSDDLVSRLKSCAKDCTMLGDEVGAAFFNEAAQALTEASAEIERLRAAFDHLFSFQFSEATRTGKLSDLCKAWIERKKAAHQLMEEVK